MVYVAFLVEERYNSKHMPIFDAIILGLVQGITEFLPISSSGHLIIARTLLGVNVSNGLAFDAVLQLATVLAVIVYFWKDLWRLLQTALRKLGRMPVNKKDETLLYAILIGTIPAVVLGLSLQSLMETVFRSAILVAGVLFIGSLLFMVAEWWYQRTPRTNNLTVWKGLQIGFFQCLALVPGMSRSGSTIVGGMFLGLTREEAARFSFLLAVPVIAGSGLKMLLDLATSNEGFDWVGIGVGSVVAFASGMVAIRFLMRFVRTHSLWPFIWYRILMAAFVAFIFFLG